MFLNFFDVISKFFRSFFDVFFYVLSFYIMSFLYFCFSMFCRSMFCHRPEEETHATDLPRAPDRNQVTITPIVCLFDLILYVPSTIFQV